MKKYKKIVKGIISYILALLLTIFFALYMNATVGWFMLVALVLAPVLSVFLAMLTRNSAKVDISLKECVLAKNDTCEMKIYIQNKSLFPTTPLEIEVLNGDGVKGREKQIILSLLPFDRQSFSVIFDAKICGLSTVGIKKVKATDYLGLIALPIRKVNYNVLQRSIAVIPNMADVSLRDDKILKVMQASLHAEDGDDTVEVSSNTFGGFPGCDNREYVQGDPIKRINWKQSAKRGKLLVRLDDVLASKSVNVVLDSTFFRDKVLIEKVANASEYNDIPIEDIPAKIAENAVETVLGIMRALIFNSYSVHFFINTDGEFNQYDLEDEKDIENIRLQLAKYVFDSSGQTRRFPSEELLDKYSTFLYCTPNDYKEVLSALKDEDDAQGMSIFSSIGDICEVSEEKKSFAKKKEKPSVSKQSVKTMIASMVVPYLLALVSGMTLFAVFGVPMVSVWTVVQAVVCAFIFMLCSYAKKHKLIGGSIISIVIVIALFMFSKVAFSGVEYLQWFMSGADTIENTFDYLMSLIYIFTLLFAMVSFYYTQVYYRTSALLFVTIIPYIVYVKLIREVEIGYVMVAIVLNVAAFLFNLRKQRDKDKRIIGYKKGLLSLLLYAVCFILIAFAVPKETETKYYHFFEEWFLGGNTSVPIPEEYGDKNEHSGNADNFNQLTNRQLYNISNADLSENLYLRRQVFDYYDFENHRWYDDDNYSEYKIPEIVLTDSNESLNNTTLLDLMKKAEEKSPGFLEKYGMEHLKDANYTETVNHATITARNFESHYLITPTKTLELSSYLGDNVKITEHHIYGNETEIFPRYVSYDVTYVSDYKQKNDWIELGGSNISYQDVQQMLYEMYTIIYENYAVGSYEYDTAIGFYLENHFSREYAKACEENTALISDEVKELALEITKDCTYEWEKAEAIDRYFLTEGFIYDLEYDAPDDSVEYFLFEGKTGTCSDFASAYVLLARAAGLTVRYVEGFVPSREVSSTYEWQYVVRTKNSHAYPEVYIPNLGFVVYEPTVGVEFESERTQNNAAFSYIMIGVIRIVAIFAVIAFMIAVILVICRVIAPAMAEKRFFKKVLKEEPSKSIIMLYKRLVEKDVSVYINTYEMQTPYEFAVKFEKMFGYDISPFIYLVEKVSYQNAFINDQDKNEAIRIYLTARKVIKEYKKNKESTRSVKRKAQ